MKETLDVMAMIFAITVLVSPLILMACVGGLVVHFMRKRAAHGPLCGDCGETVARHRLCQRCYDDLKRRARG